MSKKQIQLTLFPLKKTIEIEQGTPLRDVLFPHGVEYPCGGRGRCKGCRIRVISGDLPITPPQMRMLTKEELKAGWRLSCQCQANSDLTIELGQWEASVLSDETGFSFTPREGLGIAVDVGTTTIVAQLLDLTTGTVLSVRTALNPQARFGADIMTRVSAAVLDGARPRLVELVRKQIGKMIGGLLETTAGISSQIQQVVLVGNTVMHHLFCDLDVTLLSYYPFESPTLGLQHFASDQLGWEIPGNPPAFFLPCPGGFVGSDILAGVIATGLHEGSDYTCLIDLGTNGEIVVGNRDRILCCSTAAGPAFEGAGISHGMRASTGAISEVAVVKGQLSCSVLGHVQPRGICGSGLVDAIACMLDLGTVRPDGLIANESESIPVCSPIDLTQHDIRGLQLAKGAIAAGVRILLRETGISNDDVKAVYLAGAFGNYVNSESARKIGLLSFREEQIVPAGNTALRGAKMALFVEPRSTADLQQRMVHVGLSTDPEFQDIYVEEMSFPERP
jgi:uncharacterized 2Fe-2S/4Fe-4S cluster protein (DUF4445 family)